MIKHEELVQTSDYTLKKLIELSLAVGKTPVLEFKPLEEIIQSSEKEANPIPDSTLNQVAEPNERYE